MQLYDYQKQAVDAVASGKHIVIAPVGTGKTVISLSWAKQTGKSKVLVVTTASVRDVRGFEKEAETWYGDWYKSLSSFSVISWAGLAKWTTANWAELEDWAIIYDEVDCARAGVSSQRGKAFLHIARRTNCWTGWTATPGDSWSDFYAYFTACGKVRNKTDFQNRFCIMQRYPFPTVLSYRDTDTLQSYWDEISYNVDASEVLKQLPPEVHQTITLKQPKGYKQVIKTKTKLTGEFIENNPEFMHYLRQLCCTKEKLEWVSDFIRGLGTNAILMYNYIEEGEKLEETIKKVLPKGAKVWRIDGAVHDVPTAETIGERGVVLVQWASGSRGLNLQFIHYWVSVSPHYSYSVSTQGRGRIKRIGQQADRMFFYYLKCAKSIEEDVYRILKNKSSFSEEVWLKENGYN